MAHGSSNRAGQSPVLVHRLWTQKKRRVDRRIEQFENCDLLGNGRARGSRQKASARSGARIPAVQVGNEWTTRRVGARRRAHIHTSRWNSQVWWKSGRGSMLGRSRKHKPGAADEVFRSHGYIMRPPVRRNAICPGVLDSEFLLEQSALVVPAVDLSL